ncbi:MAG TPA: hypothetical protein VFB60_26725 [Ktedonobacteraceae bacterium]|nr:hypothetical protein [Ktedonobacteraceae bacterium]
MPIVRPVRFAANVHFARSNGYYLCRRSDVHAQVMISARLKELIEQKRWAEALSEDLEELRSLRELGFVEEEHF